MPAAAVIPAPIAYIKVVAVKKLVVGFRSGRVGPPYVVCYWPWWYGWGVLPSRVARFWSAALVACIAWQVIVLLPRRQSLSLTGWALDARCLL